jgi:hypothetical protein
VLLAATLNFWRSSSAILPGSTTLYRGATPGPLGRNVLLAAKNFRLQVLPPVLAHLLGQSGIEATKRLVRQPIEQHEGDA